MTQLQARRLSLIEYARNTHHCVPEAETPIEALLDPAYWSGVSMQLKPRDHIEVDAQDGSYFVKLRVIDCGRTFAKVHVLERHEFKDAAPTGKAPPVSEFDVKWAGPHAKWRVVRMSDGAILKDKFETMQSGQEWLIENQGSFTRAA